MVYRKDWGQPAQGGLGFARNMKAYGRKINLGINDLATTNNVVGCFMVPKDFVVINWVGPNVPAFGAGLTFSIGTPATPALFLSASTIGAAGGALPAMAATGPFTRTFLDTEVQLLVTNGVVVTAGVLEFYIYGFMV
jgi:hypothetical protein